jgi:hypothetical protein
MRLRALAESAREMGVGGAQRDRRRERESETQGGRDPDRDRQVGFFDFFRQSFLGRGRPLS